jgi:hypothetical protein
VKNSLVGKGNASQASKGRSKKSMTSGGAGSKKNAAADEIYDE